MLAFSFKRFAAFLLLPICCTLQALSQQLPVRLVTPMLPGSSAEISTSPGGMRWLFHSPQDAGSAQLPAFMMFDFQALFLNDPTFPYAARGATAKIRGGNIVTSPNLIYMAANHVVSKNQSNLFSRTAKNTITKVSKVFSTGTNEQPLHFEDKNYALAITDDGMIVTGDMKIKNGVVNKLSDISLVNLTTGESTLLHKGEVWSRSSDWESGPSGLLSGDNRFFSLLDQERLTIIDIVNGKSKSTLLPDKATDRYMDYQYARASATEDNQATCIVAKSYQGAKSTPAVVVIDNGAGSVQFIHHFVDDLQKKMEIFSLNNDLYLYNPDSLLVQKITVRKNGLEPVST